MRTFGRCFAFLVVLTTFLVSSIGRADDLQTARGQALVEIAHLVEVSIHDGVATYRVRRSFANGGTRSEEARLQLRLPPGAGATGLRIRARDRWHTGDLMEASEAARLYQELTAIGPWLPKDPALLEWNWADRLHLRVFPVLPAGTSTIEYTLTAPVEYRNGRYVVSYPYGSPGLAPPMLSVDPGHGDWTTGVWVDGQRVAAKTPVVLLPAPPPPWIGEGEPPEGESVVFSRVDVRDSGPARWARVTVDIDHTYRSDLRLALVTPDGRHLDVDASGGGGANDVREQFVLRVDVAERHGAWHLRVGDAVGLDVGTLEAWRIELSDAPSTPTSWGTEQARATTATDVPRFIPDAPQDGREVGLAEIEIGPPPIATVQARLGRVVASEDNAFLRLALELAPRLRALPRTASVVFVLDVSHSRESIAPDLATIGAYLSHVSDASVEVVTFTRTASRLFGRFVPATEATAALEAADRDGGLPWGNGSAIEAGIAAAADALRGRAGPKRVVVLTDRRLRARYHNGESIAALRHMPGAAILHVTTPTDGGPAEVLRQDDWLLARVARRTGGVAFEIRGARADEKDLPAQVLPLVRPTSIDGVELTIPELDPDDLPPVPERLREGQAFGFMMQRGAVPREVTLRGEIWSAPWTKTVRVSADYSRATAAFVFGEDEYHDLSYEEQLRVAFAGRVVSPVTSYVAIEPGARPSIDGFGELGLSGFGAGGGGMGFGARGAGVPPPPRVPLDRLMAGGVTRCLQTHPTPTGWRVELEVETTSSEIVDVLETGPTSALRACLVEEVWQLTLPSSYRDRRKLWALVLTG